MTRQKRKIAGCLLAVLCLMVAGCGQHTLGADKTSADASAADTDAADAESSIEEQTEEISQPEESKAVVDRESLYRTGEDGGPAQGWVTDSDGSVGYCGEDGYLLIGFQDIEGARYLFSEDGDMTTGLYTLENGEQILFTEDGRQYLQSVAQIGKDFYYFNENGYILKGGVIHFPDGTTGMADEEGRLYTGSHRFGDEVYTFTSLGRFRHKIDATKPMVALTYDDGPSTENTQVILDVLRTYNAHATFFVVGRSVNRCSDIIQAIEDSGSEIGNHTYNHYILDNMDAPVTYQEISSTSSYVQMITGNRPATMRPPTGQASEVSCENVAAVDNGYPLILWSLDTTDWKHRDAATTIATILDNVKDGSIVLMHDMEASSAVASQTFIPELVNAGYQLVSVSELAAARGGMKAGEIYSHFYPEDAVPVIETLPLGEAMPDTYRQSGEMPDGTLPQSEAPADQSEQPETQPGALPVVFPWVSAGS